MINKKQIIKNVISIFLITITFLLISGCNTNTNVYDTNYIQGLKYEYEGHHLKNLAVTDFETWRLYFEEGYYNEANDYCENSRFLFTEAITNFDKAYVNYEIAYASNKELIPLKLKYMNITKDLIWNNYEACEYYETATRHYANGKLEEGNKEIEMGNSKIREHDDMITEASLLSNRIEVLEE